MNRNITVAMVLPVLLAAAFMAGGWRNERKPGSDTASPARRVLHYLCPMHTQCRSAHPGECSVCGMRLEPVYDGLVKGAVAGGVKIGLDQQQLIGVRVCTVESATCTHTIRLPGRVAPDEATSYRLTAAVDGWFVEVSPVTTGTRVEKGQWLATFATADLFQSCQGYLVALKSMDQLKKAGMPNAMEINPVNSNFHQRIERLRSLGMSDLQIEEIERTREIPPSIKLYAPADGFVLTRNVSPGQRFEKGTDWYRIAELNRVWILADVFGREIPLVRPGTVARVSIAEQNLAVEGKVSKSQAQFDPATRALKVRLEAENPGFALRPEMFVDVQIPITLPPTIAVPVDAVLDSGIKQIVYVERAEGVFEPRTVATGWRFDDRVEITEGLALGDRIVVSGTFMVDSESRLKAGAMKTSATPTKDPVCGMDVDVAQASGSGKKGHQGGTLYYFCSQTCREKFENSPELYVAKLRAGLRLAGEGPTPADALGQYVKTHR